MKRFTLTLLTVLLAFSFVYAGGLVTNTNQSTAWTRMLARDASIDIDAVFYNPAGLTKLKDGFHISISNQSLFQTQTVTNGFPYLNNPEYVGNVSAPLFPSIYMAYKTGRWAFSLGFNPVGGGGGATFDKGLPSIEVPIAGAAAGFAPYGVTGYSADLYFEGTSVYWGLQGGISFAISDAISIYAGARYVMATNTYKGHVKDVSFQTGEGTVRADAFMLGIADQASAGATQATYVGNEMEPLIEFGAGGYTIGQTVQAGLITPEEGALMAGGLIQFGYPPDVVNAMTLDEVQSTYFTTAGVLTQQAAELTVGAGLMGDQDADVTQTGSGITPIVGLNLAFFEDKLNIGIKYEFMTKMDLTNETPAGKGFINGFDPETGEYTEMFPDGAITNADIPALLSIGARYQIVDNVNVQAGFHTYFDSKAGWATEDDGTELIDHNFTEIAAGVEWNISDKFLLSTGYLAAITGVNDKYQSDLSYSLSTSTFGFGGAYAFSDSFKLQLGGFYTMYNQQTVPQGGSESSIIYGETYDKATWALSIGLDIAIHSKKK